MPADTRRMDLIKTVLATKMVLAFVSLMKAGRIHLYHHQMYSVLHSDRVLVKKSGKDNRGKQKAHCSGNGTRDRNIVGRYFIEHDLGIVVPTITALARIF